MASAPAPTTAVVAPSDQIPLRVCEQAMTRSSSSWVVWRDCREWDFPERRAKLVREESPSRKGTADHSSGKRSDVAVKKIFCHRVRSDIYVVGDCIFICGDLRHSNRVSHHSLCRRRFLCYLVVCQPGVGFWDLASPRESAGSFFLSDCGSSRWMSLGHGSSATHIICDPRLG